MATIQDLEAAAPAAGTADLDLFFILPNLNPRTPTPFETKYVSICSGNDPLMERVADNAANRTGREMLKRYKPWFGRSYVPGCLLVHRDAPKQVRTAEALRGFRNVCAMASLTHSVALKLTGAQWISTYSDFFVFAAHVAGKTGWIGKLDGAVGGMDDNIERFSGHCDGQIDLPDAFRPSLDMVLFKRLTKAWESFYVIEPVD